MDILEKDLDNDNSQKLLELLLYKEIHESYINLIDYIKSNVKTR
ncbi:hypothetical protein YN1_8350 [Nanoarchaeota archaeon]